MSLISVSSIGNCNQHLLPPESWRDLIKQCVQPLMDCLEQSRASIPAWCLEVLWVLHAWGRAQSPGSAVIWKCSGPSGKDVSPLSLQKAWLLLSYDLILFWPELMSSFSLHCLRGLKWTWPGQFLQEWYVHPAGHIMCKPNPHVSGPLSHPQLLGYLPPDIPIAHSPASYTSPHQLLSPDRGHSWLSTPPSPFSYFSSHCWKLYDVLIIPFIACLILAGYKLRYFVHRCFPNPVMWLVLTKICWMSDLMRSWEILSYPILKFTIFTEITYPYATCVFGCLGRSEMIWGKVLERAFEHLPKGQAQSWNSPGYVWGAA